MGEPLSSFFTYRSVKAVATLLLRRSVLDSPCFAMTFNFSVLKLTFTFRYLTRFSAQAPADGWKAAQMAKEEKVSLPLDCETVKEAVLAVYELRSVRPQSFRARSSSGGCTSAFEFLLGCVLKILLDRLAGLSWEGSLPIPSCLQM